MTKARGRVRETAKASKQSIEDQVDFVIRWLERHSSKGTLDGMVRYAIPSGHAYGVAMKDIKALGTRLGRNQPLAVALWNTGVYEARMLVSFVGDPTRLTAAQMERWGKDFDNWAFCDAMSGRRLAESKDATARWVGKDALRELTSPAVTARLEF